MLETHEFRFPPSPETALRPDDVAGLTDWARRLTGITLRDRKAEFLTARLGKRVAARGVDGWGAYRRLLAEDPDEQIAFAEALTTHTTSFFREKAQYDWLLDHGFPTLLGDGLGRREILIWSAACSTGQEGWTALMVAEQVRMKGRANLETRLIGTDLSRPVLRTAAQAIYPEAQIEGIPEDLRPRVLLSSRTGERRFRITPDLRARATWRQANLATGDGLAGISADVVFLRNVLIYFDEDVRATVIDNVYQRLKPGGILFVGHTEAGHVRRYGLVSLRPSILRKGDA